MPSLLRCLINGGDMLPVTNVCPYEAYEQQIMGEEGFIERIQKRMSGMERKTTKLPIDELVQAVEKETGVELLDLVSRRRGEGLRCARGILVFLAKEIGYTLTELQRILKPDVSVSSRLAAISETTGGQKLLRKIRNGLNAQQQACAHFLFCTFQG